MLPVTWRGAPRPPARRVGAARLLCPGGPTPPPGARALRRSSGRLVAIRRGSLPPLELSTPLPEVLSLPEVLPSLPDVLPTSPDVSSTPSCEPKAALVVHSVLAGQPLRPRARCVCIRYGARCVGQQRSRLQPFGAGTSCFLRVGRLRAKRRGYATGRRLPSVPLTLVRRDRRPFESYAGHLAPRGGIFASGDPYRA